MNKKEICTFCPFMADKVEVPYAGSKTASVIVVGDTPHHEEERKKVPFAGKSATLISKVLDTTNLTKQNVFFTNACRCGFNKDTDSTKDINQALRQCRNFLSLVIEQIKPKLIIVMGAYALQQVLGKKAIMKNRGKFVYSEEYKCNVFITVNPRYSLRGANKDYPNIKFNMMSMQEKMPFQDFKQVTGFFNNECVPPTIDEDYHEVPNFDEYLNSKIVAFDYETTGLNVYDSAIKLLSVSMSKEKGSAGVYVFDDNKEPVQSVHPSFKEIMENPSITKVVASRPFDESFSKVKLGIETKGTVHDVLQMAHLVDENYYQYNLESVSDVYTDLSSIKDLAEGMRATLIDAPRETLINYSGVDSDATLRSFHSLKEEINKDKYLPTYYKKFVLPTQEMFRQIEYNGCKIDTEVLRKNEQYAITLKEELHQKAIEELPEAITEDKKHKGNLRLSRSALIVDYLFTHKRGLRLKPSPRYITPKNKTPRTCEEHLVMFEHIPFVSYLLRWKKVEKVYGSYIKNLWNFISEDGFIHPSTLLTRTVTGRTVMLGPAIQTYPKRGEFAKLIREAVVAEEGWLLADRDLGQSELRIHAWLANDRMLLDAFDAGIDPHKQTAAMVSQKKIEDVTKDERQGAKGVNFGCIGKGQLVLTNNGLISIEDVSKDDLVWDGIEYVEHDGVVYQGYREVINFDGLVATPDHPLFLQDGGKDDIETIERDGRKGRIAIGEINGKAVGYSYIERRDITEWALSKNRRILRILSKTKDVLCGLHYERNNFQLFMSKGEKVSKRHQIPETRRTLRCNGTEMQQSEIGVLPKLWRAWDSAKVRVQRAIHILDDRELAPRNIQRSTDRQDRQQWELRAGKSTISNSEGESLQYKKEYFGGLSGKENTSTPYVRGIKNAISRLSLLKKVDFSSIYKRINSGGSSKKKEERRWSHVYDITNAGSRHRFTVSGYVVHNSIFGSSAKGLSAYIRENYGVDYSVKECEGILKKFFAKPSGYYKMAEYNKAVSREVGRKGFVRSPLGRIRRLPNAQGDDWRLKGDAERQAVNFRTQSHSSDYALISMFLFNQAIQKSDRLRDSVKVLFFIHDAIMFTAKKEVMNEAMALLRDCMQYRAVSYIEENFKDKKGKPLKIGYPIITDGNMGLSWAGMEEMEEVKEEWR